MPVVRSLVLAAGMLFLVAPAFAEDLRDVPALRARVTDLTGTLTVNDAATLDAQLATLEEDTGSQVAVLIVDSTLPESIEQYAIRVADAWRLGRGGVDDGILILVALSDRRIRMDVGYGLEGALPDARANRIIDERMTPRFAAGDVAGGLAAGVDALAASIRGEALPAPAQRSRGLPDIGGMLPILLIVGMTIGGALKRALGSFPGAMLAGGIVGVIVWFLVGVILTALLAGIIAFVVTMFMSAGPGAWSSGRGYGGGFGGRGGGGFSGGGGRFGGGGASGGW